MEPAAINYRPASHYRMSLGLLCTGKVAGPFNTKTQGDARREMRHGLDTAFMCVSQALLEAWSACAEHTSLHKTC